MCVILNDIFAYIFGFFLGKTPLIKLSPKKTWEGFIGGALVTLVWAFIASDYLTDYEFLACQQKKISVIPFDYPTCEIDAIYQSTIEVAIPFWKTVFIAPVQIHAFMIALFACTLAPFGGFFASGFKRAFKIKDFGNSIPGHGGITD